MSGAPMWFAVAAAGGLGAVARYLVDLGVAHLGSGSSQPAGAVAKGGVFRRNIRPSASRGSLADDGASSRSASRPRLGTMIVNVSGSLFAGMAAGSAIGGHLGVEVETVVAGGFLGAYTTFSTAMFQAVAELEERRPLNAMANLIATLTLAVGAAWCGVAIMT